MIDLHDLARSVLEKGREASQQAAKDGQDFLPIFFPYRDNEVTPVPIPHYAADRAFHQGLMRAVLDGTQSDGFVMIHEAWISSYPINAAPDTRSPDFVPPSRDPKREEMLLVYGMSRAGDQAGYCCKIKRHGHKLAFGPIENMTDQAHGKSFIAAMGAMFGERAN